MLDISSKSVLNSLWRIRYGIISNQRSIKMLSDINLVFLDFKSLTHFSKKFLIIISNRFYWLVPYCQQDKNLQIFEDSKKEIFLFFSCPKFIFEGLQRTKRKIDIHILIKRVKLRTLFNVPIDVYFNVSSRILKVKVFFQKILQAFFCSPLRGGKPLIFFLRSSIRRFG